MNARTLPLPKPPEPYSLPTTIIVTPGTRASSFSQEEHPQSQRDSRYRWPQSPPWNKEHGARYQCQYGGFSNAP